MQEYLENINKSLGNLLIEKRGLEARLKQIDAQIPEYEGAISAIQQIANAEAEQAKATAPNPAETKVA